MNPYSEEKYNFVLTGYEPMRKELKGYSYAELYVVLEALKRQNFKDIEVTESDNTIERR